VATAAPRTSDSDLSKAIAFFGGAEMPAQVWSRKYRLRDKEDSFLEESPLQTFCRMADAVGASTNSTLRQNLIDRRIIPAGRMLFALGNPFFRAAVKNCLTGDSWVRLADGWARLQYIATHSTPEAPVTVVIDGEEKNAHAWSNGVKKIVQITTKEGHTIKATPNHRFRLEDGSWCEAGSLKAGDLLDLGHNTGSYGEAAEDDFVFGYAAGLFLGDGGTYAGQDFKVANIRLFGQKAHVPINIIAGMFGGQPVHYEDHVAYNSSEFARALESRLGLSHGNKRITDRVMQQSSVFHAGFLRGLFDADACVTLKYRTKGTIQARNIRLGQSDLDDLRKVQTLLLGFDIKSKVYANGEAGVRDFGDKGSYECRAAWVLNISRDSFRHFVEQIGFSHPDKAAKAQEAVHYGRFQPEIWAARVESVEDAGEAEVFDMSVDDIHAFNANGLIAHNCFVLLPKDDSLEAISELRGEMARTYAMGGGVGIDLSKLRPQGAPVNNCALTSSGAASFADGFSHLTGEIGQNGRRGALMISMSVDHPDVKNFIHAKNDFSHEIGEQLRERLPRKLFKQLVEEVIDPRRSCGNANMSVRISDRFMKAVKEGQPHIARFVMDDGEIIERVFDARELWREILTGAWAHGCPGVMFWDTAARDDNRNYLDERWHIVTCNPCGEMMLSDGGSCNLGAINLARFTTNPYTERAEFDWESFKQSVRDGVDFLDEVNDIELREGRAPLKKQAEVTEGLRQIGLGVMGYGDLLLQHQIRYGSDEAMEFTEKLFRCLRDTAYHQSIMRAKEHGPFPAYSWEKISRSPFIRRLPAELQRLMEKHGLRNSNVLSIAPTGTIAIMGETTSGIEPEFAFQLTRAVNLGDGRRTKYTFLTPTAQRIAKALGISIPQGEIEGRVDMSWLPEWAVASHQIDPCRRAQVQGLIQQFIDVSISSTVNLPESATVEDVETVYMTAYEQGCKGITIYREGSRGGVLETLSEEDRLEYPIEPPLQVSSRRVSFKGEHGLQRILINIGDYRPGVPCEVSIIHGKSGTELASYASAMGILISIALENGVSPIKIARVLEGINAGWVTRLALDGKGKKPVVVQSVPDAIAVVLRKLYGNGIYEKGVAGQPLNGAVNTTGWELTAEERNRAQTCPKCQKQTYIPDGGCWKCVNPVCEHDGTCG